MNSVSNGFCTSSTGAAPAAFASALQFFAAAQCLITEDWPEDSSIDDFEEFDFIVVGAGSAGSIVANRLTEVDEWKVLLIEAGDDPPVESIVPNLSGSLYGTKFDWQYQTENDGRTGQGNKGGKVLWPRGKMLGGSSSINAMIYIRGNKQDYQRWYDEGNEDWHPDVVEKYFQKAENLQDKTLLKNPKASNFYGKSGPLVINSFNNSRRIVNGRILKAWDEIGIKNVPDLNIANAMGSGNIEGTASDGSRNSAATAYLNPIKNRSNLKLMKNTLVTKILLNPHKNVAYGVETERHGKKQVFFTKREVILSAGAINTPQLLMLSGIGPKKHLNSFNIESVINLPAVGKNLQDHLVVPVTIYGNEDQIPDDANNHIETLKYLTNRSGYLSQSAAAHVSAFYSNKQQAHYPLYQSLFGTFAKNNSNIANYFSYVNNHQSSVVKSITDLSTHHSLFYFVFILLHPYSTGSISLRSSNPYDKPLIYANYFKDPRDITSAVNGIKILTRLVNTTYFKSINGFLGRMKWQECDSFELDSEEYWKCISINMVGTIYHPVGTAKMGSNQNTSVVDSHLRVHGVKNLRVVDASIMPSITSGNTNGPVIMIGERASDLIKMDHQVKVP